MTLKEVVIITETKSGIKRYKDRVTFSLRGLEIKDGGCLVAIYGDKKTLTAAKKDYAKQLCSKRVVMDAMKPDRREYTLPSKITA